MLTRKKQKNFKNGFSLIELLTVIIVLSVITLISIPIIINVVQNIKRESIIDSGYSIIRASEYYYAKNSNIKHIDLSMNNLEIKNKKLSKGEVIFNNDGIPTIYFYQDGYCVYSISSQQLISEKTAIDECNNKKILNNKVSGQMLHLASSIGLPLVDTKIYGNIIQNGTPSLSAPSSIDFLGQLNSNGKYDVDVISFGSNILNANILTPPYLELGNKVINSNTVIVNNWAARWLNNSKIKLVFNSGQKYFVNYKITMLEQMSDPINYAHTNPILGLVNGNATIIIPSHAYNIIEMKVGEIFNGKNTFITPIDFGENFLCFYSGILNSNQTKRHPTIKVEYSITLEDTDKIEPYKEMVNKIELNEPLRKVGNVADYIDYAKKQIIRNVGKIELDGTEVKLDDNLFYVDINNKSDISISNYFSNIAYIDRLNMQLNSYYLSPVTKRIYFNTQHSTLQEFRDFLKLKKQQGVPVTVYYELDNPKYENIMLNDIKTYKGATNIKVMDNKMLASNIEAYYYKQ